MEKVQILIGIIGIIIGTNIIPSFAAATYAFSTTEKTADGRIICTLNYTDYQTISATLSKTDDYYDTSSYFLLDSKDYNANSFNEFEQKYPYFTMTTSGKAVSESTFGDVGKNKFGPRILFTNEFLKKPVLGYIVFDESAEKWSTYYVNARMGIYFFREHHNSTKLIAVPYLSGTLTSHGIYTRSLDFGWTIETITFIPKN
ncbi:hypothetical protein PV325_012895 [Microctonus aethiopoides]|nr:hypothetical protein PV325_012895 [Microctonus aethiopoides]